MSKATGVPAEKLALYEKLVAANPNVERKGATMPYTSLNGHMFSFLTETGTVAIRLPNSVLCFILLTMFIKNSNCPSEIVGKPT